jgi:hypothetical protein
MSISLKLQQAWEMIMLKYGKNYADACMIHTGMATIAFAEPTLTSRQIADVAMSRNARG